MRFPLPDTLIHIDLSAGAIRKECIPSEWIRQFLGGKGVGARYLYDALSPETDPLGPDNVLLFLVGPLTGWLPGDGRMAVVTKSPLTGLFLDSYIGGSFATAFRASDPSLLGISLVGSSDTLQVIDLRDDEPTIEDVPELRGSTIDVVDSLYADASVLAIGPAGEAKVRYATIGADGGAHHAGRGGAGAVMGAKGVKAIVTPQIDTFPPPNDDIRFLQKRAREQFSASPYGRAYRVGGTMESVTFADTLSILPTRGWRERSFDGAEEIGLSTAQSAAIGRERGDEVFPGDFQYDVEEHQTVLRGGTPIALGAGLGIADFDAITMLGSTCDRFGLDVISAGNAIALAILASETGTIDRPLSFGDEDTARTLLSEISTRSTPLGRILAEGVASAAHVLDLTGAIPTIKSMVVPSFDPRGAPTLALAYATSDRGACHRRSVPAAVEVFKDRLTATQIATAVQSEQDRRALLWCLIADDVLSPALHELDKWLGAIGLTLSPSSLTRIGTRAWTMTRLFNVREGTDRSDDALPEIFRAADPSSAITETQFSRALTRYYELREWDRDGIPSKRLLDRLDLLSVIDPATPIGDHPLHPPMDPIARRTDADG